MTQTESKSQDILEERETMENLNKENSRLDAIWQGLKKNPSFTTALHYFKEMLPQNCRYDYISKMVKQLTEKVKALFKFIPDLVLFVGKEMVDNYYELINKFNLLLQQTRSSVDKVYRSARRQQNNMEDMLDCINCMDPNKEFNKNDINDYQECVKTLKNWINEQDLEETAKKWNDFVFSCQEQEKQWTEKIEKSRKETDNKWKSGSKIGGWVLGILGGLAMVGGVVAICVLTGGVAAPILAAIGTGVLIKTAIVGTGAALAGVGMLAYGYSGTKKTYVVSNKVYKKALKIQQKIKDMMSFGQEMSNKLGKLNDVNGGIGELYNDLRDTDSRRRIISTCKELKNYLIEYQEKGKQIIKDVDECQNTMVQQLKV